MLKYNARIGGSSWSRGPTADFQTIKECRDWAEDYGTTADWCVIHDRKGRVVAEHRRDPSSNHWFKAWVVD